MFLPKLQKKNEMGRKGKQTTISRISTINFLHMISKYIQNVPSDDKECHSIPIYHF